MESLRDRIKRHEGLRLTPYQDSEGHWTVGYGHLMSNPIPQEAAEIIFRDDYKKALKCFFELPIGVRLTTSGPASYGLNVTRREVLVEMIFQLGLNGVLGFKKMIEALEAMDYEKAADEILDSKAARQCPERFQEYADLMRVG